MTIDPTDRMESINGREWLITRESNGETEAYAGAWPRAMMENAQYRSDQPVWIGVTERNGIEVPIRKQDTFRHEFAGGTTGAGKSTHLINYIVQLVLAGEGFAYIDPKGDDTPEILRRIPEERWDDVVYVAPGEDYLDSVVGFNLLETHHTPEEPGYDREISGIVDDLVALLGAEDYWGVRMDRIAKNMIGALARHEKEFTPIEVAFALLDEDSRQEYAAMVGSAIEDEDIRFLEGYAQKIADELDDDDIEPILGRFLDWIENPIPRRLIAQRGADVTIGEIVTEQKILLVNNDLPPDSQKMVSSVVMRRLWTAINSRLSREQKRFMELAGEGDRIPDEAKDEEYDPYYLLLDEVTDILTDAAQIDEMLRKARSKNLGLVLATQSIRSLSDDAQDALLANCNTLLSLNPNLPEEARQLSARFEKDKEALLRLDDYHAWTRVRTDGGSLSEPFMVKLFPPYPPVHDIDTAYEIMASSVQQYGQPRKTGTEMLEELHFAGDSFLGGAVGADGDVPGDRTGASSAGVEATDELVRTALGAMFHEALGVDPWGTLDGDYPPVPVGGVRDRIEAATSFTGTQVDNLLEQLPTSFVEHERVDETQCVQLTGKGESKLFDTGSGGSGGRIAHRTLIRRAYSQLALLGFDMDLPQQGGSEELPDAIANLPVDYPPRLKREYPAIHDLSQGVPLTVEAESKTLSKGYKPCKNLRKAVETERRCLFAVHEGGDAADAKARTLQNILVNDGEVALTASRQPADVTDAYYQGPEYTVEDDGGEDVLVVYPDPDAKPEWVRIGEQIICRDSQSGDEYVSFDGASDVAVAGRDDFPAVARETDEGWAVTAGGDTHEYDTKAALREEWPIVYAPFIPRLAFGEMGLPTADDYEIVIVPDEKDTPLLWWQDGSMTPLPGTVPDPGRSSEATADGEQGDDPGGRATDSGRDLDEKLSRLGMD